MRDRVKKFEQNQLAKVGAYLFITILFFAISVLCATLFTFLMAEEKRNLSSGEKIKSLWLAKIQWLLFTLGLLFLLAWIGILSK